MSGAIVIGCRATDSGRRPIAGSKEVPCADCGEIVMFSPATLARPEASSGTARFLCLQCGAPKLEGLLIAEPTVDQKQELSDAGIDPESWALRELWGKTVPSKDPT